MTQHMLSPNHCLFTTLFSYTLQFVNETLTGFKEWGLLWQGQRSKQGQNVEYLHPQPVSLHESTHYSLWFLRYRLDMNIPAIHLILQPIALLDAKIEQNTVTVFKGYL